MNRDIEHRAAELYDRFRQRSSKDDEFHDWEEYRAQLTEFVVKNTRKGASLLILGAGKCNDLDLGILREHCGSMALCDYRPETAEEAFRRYELEPSAHLRFVQADFVGITDEDYLAYTKHLLRVMEKLQAQAGDSLEDIAGEELQALQEELERIYRDNESYQIYLGADTYDYAVIAGVHSQLNNSFRGIFQYVRKDVEDAGGKVRYLKELNEAIFQCTRTHTLDLVRRFNEAVFAVVRDGVVYGYEDSIIFTPEGRRLPVIGTVDGARQAGEELEELPVTEQMKCLWPLSRRRRIKFDMIVCYIDFRRGLKHTERLEIFEATDRDVDRIIEIESHPENRDFLWVGTPEEHQEEIRDPGHLLLLFRDSQTKTDWDPATDGYPHVPQEIKGYALIRLDHKSDVFEIRRVAITEKGKGYGREAMEALIEYAFEETQTNRLWLDVYPDNPAGIHLYESLGMHRDGVLRQNYKAERGYLDQIIYSLLREEYENTKGE